MVPLSLALLFHFFKWSTYEMQNFPTIKELFAEDGKSLNFLGVIISSLNVALDQKERSAVMVRNIALNLGVIMPSSLRRVTAQP